ncbi:hypothetical protein CRG98_001654 [Punica granatum]|uniref:NFD4 C-terminal domain-containing protein n=1 Tax=Punica granatum TaxID=22663 RepID=A0A2I0LBG4_PUNGR|nr:hypothetical protein CRG98_001654 [Punica granatum]
MELSYMTVKLWSLKYCESGSRSAIQLAGELAGGCRGQRPLLGGPGRSPQPILYSANWGLSERRTDWESQPVTALCPHIHGRSPMTPKSSGPPATTPNEWSTLLSRAQHIPHLPTVCSPRFRACEGQFYLYSRDLWLYNLEGRGPIGITTLPWSTWGVVAVGATSSSSPNRGLLAPRPWLVHLAGAIQPPVPVTCLFMLVAAHGQTFFHTSNVVSGVHNFSGYGRTIVGIMKEITADPEYNIVQYRAKGLSRSQRSGAHPSLLHPIQESAEQFHPHACPLPYRCLPLALFFFPVRIYDTNARGDKKHLNSFLAVALTIAACLMVLIVLKYVLTLAASFRIITFCVLLLLILWPLRVAVAAMRQEFIESDKFLLETNILVSGSQSEPGKDTEEAPSQYPASSIDAAIQNTRVHMNIIQAVCTGNFWLLFIAMGLARPLVMAIMWFIRTGGHVIIASGFPGNLYIGSTLVGVCFGSLWSLMPTITSEIFGLSHMGTIFNTIAIASPVGSYILSERVIGYIYDKEATGDGNSCYGTHCFMLSSLILASVAFFWFLVNLLLFFRTRSSY